MNSRQPAWKAGALPLSYSRSDDATILPPGIDASPKPAMAAKETGAAPGGYRFERIKGASAARTRLYSMSPQLLPDLISTPSGTASGKAVGMSSITISRI